MNPLGTKEKKEKDECTCSEKLNIDKYIKELLEGGKTPEAIYEYARTMKKELNESKLKEEIDRMKKARTDLIMALDEYIYTLLDTRLDPEQAADMEKSLIEIEKTVFKLDNMEQQKRKRGEESAGDADKQLRDIIRILRLW